MRTPAFPRPGHGVLWGLLTVAVTVALAVASVQSAWVGLSVVAGLAIVVFCWRSPERAFVVWLGTVAFLPIWVSTPPPLQVPVLSVVGVVAVASAGVRQVRFSPIDAVVGAAFFFFALAASVARAPLGELTNIASLWLVGYFAARVLVSQTGLRFAGDWFARVMALVGLLAVLEFTTGWHPYQALEFDNLLFTIWSPIQERGGVFRSEWAFGHSIALGGALSLALPFAIYTRARVWTKVFVVAALVLGVSVTFSRAALLSMALSLALVVLVGKTLRLRARIAIVAVGTLGLAAVLPAILGVFDSAGEEVVNSGAYRGDLLTALPMMSPFGLSSSAQVNQAGFRTFGRFTSVDSALIAVGLDFGWLLGGALAGAYLLVIVRVVVRRASLPELALAGQLPLVLTVAFITQWQLLLWVVAGMAVVANAERSRAPNELAHDELGASQVDRGKR